MENSKKEDFLNPKNNLKQAQVMDVLKMISWTQTEMQNHVLTLKKEDIFPQLESHSKFFFINTSKAKGIKEGILEKGKFNSIQPNPLRIIWNDGILKNIINGKLGIQGLVKFFRIFFFYFKDNYD